MQKWNSDRARLTHGWDVEVMEIKFKGRRVILRPTDSQPQPPFLSLLWRTLSCGLLCPSFKNDHLL